MGWWVVEEPPHFIGPAEEVAGDSPCLVAESTRCRAGQDVFESRPRWLGDCGERPAVEQPPVVLDLSGEQAKLGAVPRAVKPLDYRGEVAQLALYPQVAAAPESTFRTSRNSARAANNRR